MFSTPTIKEISTTTNTTIIEISVQNTGTSPSSATMDITINGAKTTSPSTGDVAAGTIWTQQVTLSGLTPTTTYNICVENFVETLPPPPPTENLLTNPGFETAYAADPTKPDNWQGVWQIGSQGICSYPETGRVGGRSVAFEYAAYESIPGKFPEIATGQIVTIDPTKIYKLGGWIKTLNILSGPAGWGSAFIAVDWLDVNRNWIGNSQIGANQSGTKDWTYYEGNVTPTAGAAYAYVGIGLMECYGKAWFDDISLVEVIYYPI